MILGNLYMKRKRYLISILMNLATVLEEEEEEEKKKDFLRMHSRFPLWGPLN